MATSTQISGDYLSFRRDLSKYSSNLNIYTKRDFKQNMLKTAKFWKTRFNLMITGDGHPSLATAQIDYRDNTSNSQATVKIKDEAWYYDLAKPHFVSLKKVQLRRWVQKNWIYAVGPRNGSHWLSSQQWGRQSSVKGSMNNPRGFLFVLSRKDKLGKSIIEETNKASEKEVRRIFAEKVPKDFRNIIRNSFTKRTYNIQVKVAA